MLLDALGSVGALKPIPFDEREQYEFLFELARWAPDGMPTAPVSILNEIYRLVTSAIWRATIWPGLEVTWFMLGAYVHHYRPPRMPTAFETQDIASWYFETFLRHRVNDRFLTWRQRRALAAPSGGARAPALAIYALAARPIPSSEGWSSSDETLVPEEAPTLHGLFQDDYSRSSGAAVAPMGARDPLEAGAMAVGRVLRASEVIFCGLNGNHALFGIEDTWNEAEQDFCWARGQSGVMVFQFAGEAKSLLLDADVRLVNDGSTKPNHFTILFNGRIVYEKLVLATENRRVLVPIDQPARPIPALNVLIFRIDRPFFPSQWGSHDGRCLGVGLERVWIHANV